jgi:hypothetical protein
MNDFRSMGDCFQGFAVLDTGIRGGLNPAIAGA